MTFTSIKTFLFIIHYKLYQQFSPYQILLYARPIRGREYYIIFFSTISI